MQLVAGANVRIKKLIYSKNIQAFYKDICEKVQNQYATVFATSMQTLITKIACMIDQILVEPKKTGRDYFLGAISYLCLTVIGSRELYNALMATKINQEGNVQKHGFKDTTINIDMCVYQYNRLINQLASVLGLNELKKLYIPLAKAVGENGAAQNTAQNIAQQNLQQTSAQNLALQNLQQVYLQNIALQNSQQALLQKTTPPKAKQPQNKNSNVLVSSSASSGADADKKTLQVKMLKGDGIITQKYLLKPNKQCIDFKLEVSYKGPAKLLSVSAEIPLKDKQKKVFAIGLGTKKFSLDIEKYEFPHVKVTVTAIIKVGFLKTKKLVCTIDKIF